MNNGKFGKMAKSPIAPGPWEVDGDEADEYDVLDAHGDIICEVSQREDADETERHAFLLAGAWRMHFDIREAIRLLRDGEDQEALKVLRATLSSIEPVESSDGHQGNSSETPGQAGGTNGEQRGTNGSREAGSSS